MFRRITIAAALVASACAPGQVLEDYRFEPASNEAIVVLSTRVDDRCGGSSNVVQVGYEGLAANDLRPGAFILTNSWMTHDFPDPPGFFYIRRLDAGEYRLTRITKSSSKASFQTKKDLDVLFRIDPGQVYYLGEFHVTVPNCTAFNIKFNDQRQRDGALFDKRMKNLRSSQFRHLALKVTP